jgi:hypothetical protein
MLGDRDGRVLVRIPLVFVAVVALVTLAPTVAASDAAITFDDLFEHSSIVVRLDVKDDAAADLRHKIDAFGNEDGTVTADEAEEYGDHLDGTLGRRFLETLGGNLSIDRRGPESSIITGFLVRDAPGPAETSDPITLEITMEVTWHPEPKPLHALEYRTQTVGHVEGIVAGVVHVTVTMPPGATILENGPGEVNDPIVMTMDDRSSATFTDEPGAPSVVSLAFRESEAVANARSTPFPAAPLALAAVVTIAVVRKKPDGS